MQQPAMTAEEILPRPPSNGKMMKRLRRFFSRVAVRFIVRRNIKSVSSVRISDFSLKVLPGVFHPSYYLSSRYFANVLSRRVDFTGKRVLDLGCGSGILSLVAARGGASVVSVDVNPEAVRCTQINAAANNLSDRIHAIESNLFDKLLDVGLFDYIITNPPFFEGKPASLEESAWKGGPDQLFIKTVAREAQRFLLHDGCVVCVLSSDGNVAEQVRFFTEAGFTGRLLSSKRFLFERMYVLAFSPNSTEASLNDE